MASSEVPAPRLPDPTIEYDVGYMNDLVRTIQLFMEQEKNPGQLRATNITLTNLPTSPTGLEVGSLWNDAGTVKIVT
tara:strand:- start:4242 stop:4472 length:231 start_codon:yes stop_codon:yes gene_type:complete